MYYLKQILFATLLMLSSLGLRASHIAGGDMLYSYLGVNTNGRHVYEVTLNLFQDCKNGDPKVINKDNPANFSFFKKSNSNFLYTKTITASATNVTINSGINPICFDNLPDLCLQKAVFKFNFELPNPSEANYDPEGYVIAYQRCCRNKIISNVANAHRVGTTLFTVIPSAPAVINNSPLPNDPPLIICMNTPQRMNYSSIDPDGDSLDYYLCTSYLGASEDNSSPTQTSPPPFQPLTYRAPYTYESPVPSVVPIILDRRTGMLEFEPDRPGVFTIVVCIDEYRNGVKIAEHHRETQFFISSCSKKSYARIPVLQDQPEIHQIVCDGYQVNFSNTSSGASEYYWDFGDPNSTTDFSTQKYPSYTYPDTGTYEVKLYTDLSFDCPDSVVKLVKVYPYFETNFNFEGVLCPYQPITFIDSTYSSIGYIDYRYWNFDDGLGGTDSIEIHEFGNETRVYNVSLISTNNLGCKDTAVKEVSVLGVDLFAGNDTTVLKQLYFQLGAYAEAQVQWTPSTFMDDPTLPNPTFYFPESGEYLYAVQTTNELGCIGRDTILITVADKKYFFIPTAYTPNGDGLNDFIQIKTAGIAELVNFEIYNRWGQKIFSSLNIKDRWDGTFNEELLPIGTYYWVGIGIDLHGIKVINKGEITLIR